MVIPNQKARSHALLTRPPLTPKGPLDLHVLSLPPAFALSQDQTLTLKRLIWPITYILRRSLTSTKHPTLHSAKHPSVSSERRTTDRHKSLTPDPKAWPQGQTPPASPFLNPTCQRAPQKPEAHQRQTEDRPAIPPASPAACQKMAQRPVHFRGRRR